MLSHVIISSNRPLFIPIFKKPKLTPSYETHIASPSTSVSARNEELSGHFDWDSPRWILRAYLLSGRESSFNL